MLWRSRPPQPEIESLRQELRDAQDRIQDLEAELVSLYADEEEELYRAVGLWSGCSNAALEAAHKALRRQFHPDGWPPDLKGHATATFQCIEDTFRRIEKLRAE